MRFFNFFLNHMVQKYQSEIAPIFYYGISTWKRPKNTYFTAPWLKTSLLNDTVCSDSFDIILTMCHIITTLLITLISNMFQNSGKFQLLRFTKTLFATPGTLQFVGQFLSAFLCARPWGKGQRKILLLANSGRHFASASDLLALTVALARILALKR